MASPPLPCLSSSDPLRQDRLNKPRTGSFPPPGAAWRTPRWGVFAGQDDCLGIPGVSGALGGGGHVCADDPDVAGCHAFTVCYIVDFRRRRLTKDRIFTRIFEAIEETNGRVQIATASMDITLLPADRPNREPSATDGPK